MPKTYAQFIKDTNNKGISKEDAALMAEFGKVLNDVAANLQSDGSREAKQLGITIRANRANFGLIGNMATSDSIKEYESKKAAADALFTSRCKYIASIFSEITNDPVYLEKFVKAGTQGNNPPLGKKGEKLVALLPILTDTFGLDINVDVLEDAVDPELKNTREQRAQARFASKLDQEAVGLSAKHNNEGFFRVGTSSAEHKKVKDAVADYKAFMANPNDPKFAGKTELDMLEAMKGAADFYIKEKRTHGRGDTTKEDWEPGTEMGKKRFRASKSISQMANERINKIKKQIAAQKQTVNERLADVLTNADEVMLRGKVSSGTAFGSEKYLEGKLADILAWKKIAAEHGNERAFDNMAAFNEEREKIFKSDGFNVMVTKLSTMSEDERVEIFKDADKLAVMHEHEKQAFDKLNEKYGKCPEGTIGYTLQDNIKFICARKDEVTGVRVVDILANAMYVKEHGMDAPKDGAIHSAYKKQIDAALVDDMVNQKGSAGIKDMLTDPDSFLDIYNKELDLKQERLRESTKDMPGDIGNYQKSIEDVINGDEPKTPEEFENAKRIVMRNTAAIIATKTIWKEPDKRTADDIRNETKGLPGGEVKMAKTIHMRAKEKVDEARGKNYSDLQPEEKMKLKPDELLKIYRKELEQKTRQRDEMGKEIYEKRDDFKLMFAGVKDWKSLKDISKTALTYTAGGLIQKLHEAGKEIEKQKKLGEQGREVVSQKVNEKVLGN